MSADAFEPAYRAIYLGTKDQHLPADVFDRVDGFFAETDAYVADPDLRDLQDGDLDADQLRDRARALLRDAGLSG